MSVVAIHTICNKKQYTIKYHISSAYAFFSHIEEI